MRRGRDGGPQGAGQEGQCVPERDVHPQQDAEEDEEGDVHQRGGAVVDGEKEQGDLQSDEKAWRQRRGALPSGCVLDVVGTHTMSDVST